MHLILTGATGLVGTAILNHILHHHTTHGITKLTILTRDPSIPLLKNFHSTHPAPPTLSLNIIHHTDFLTYPSSLLSTLTPKPSALIWALGISQNSVSSPSEYATITRDYALAAARAFGSLNPSSTTDPAAHDNSSSSSHSIFKFIYISGEGATQTPSSLFTPLFSRVKGETESLLLALNNSPEYPGLRIFNVRPGGVDASHDPEVAAAMRTKKGVKRWEGVLLAVLGKCWPAMISPTGVLGRVVVELVVGDGEALRGGEGEGVSAGGRTVRNKAVRRMGGL